MPDKDVCFALFIEGFASNTTEMWRKYHQKMITKGFFVFAFIYARMPFNFDTRVLNNF